MVGSCILGTRAPGLSSLDDLRIVNIGDKDVRMGSRIYVEWAETLNSISVRGPDSPKYIPIQYKFASSLSTCCGGMKFATTM